MSRSERASCCLVEGSCEPTDALESFEHRRSKRAQLARKYWRGIVYVKLSANERSFAVFDEVIVMSYEKP